MFAVLAVGGFWLRAPGGVLRQHGLSVLLITIDTLRADALGNYGDKAALTPTMDRLAAAGVRFDDAHAQNVTTLPSHANILSGRYPMDHGVRDNAGFRFPLEPETIATLLKARGYRTAAFVSAFPLASRFGLARGFDAYEDSFVDARARPAFLEQERAGSETVALARRWLEPSSGQPFFCWVHVYEPHSPYEPPEPFASRYKGDLYRGEVATADAALRPLLEPFLGAGADGRTLVVLTADHGESLGEHGEATHGILAYEATLHVPLILYAPRLLRPRVVAAAARHVDILPTILDALALPEPDGLAGHSLLPLAAGRAAGAPVTSYFEALSGPLNRGWAPLHGVIRGGAKYVDLPIPELYDLRADPRETDNLAATQPVRLEEMRALLSPLRAMDRGLPRRPESAETRQRLESLGYLSAGADPRKTRYTEEDDPKRLGALDAILQEVVSLYRAGDLESALARCRDLVRLRPDSPLSLLHLAHIERESGDLPAAVETLRKAFVLNSEDATTVSLLGTYLTQAGRAREAVDLLEPYSRRETPDVEVLIARSLALAKLGRTKDALAMLERAREVDPKNAMVLVVVGTVQLMAHDPKRAREAFEAALDQNPKVARAHSSLAVMAAEDGRVAEATEHWKKAMALDPQECDKPLVFGALLWRRGRRAEARRYLELFVASAPRALYAREIERAESWLSGSAFPGPESLPAR